MSRIERYPDFFRLATDLQAGDIDFTGKYAQNPENLVREVPLAAANGVSSRIRPVVKGFQYHKVVIDLDMDAALMPSSTPGHHHLIIDTAISTVRYHNVLQALAAAGIIETGYLRAFEEREATWIRTPWEKKVEPPTRMPKPPGQEDQPPW